MPKHRSIAGSVLVATFAATVALMPVWARATDDLPGVNLDQPISDDDGGGQTDTAKPDAANPDAANQSTKTSRVPPVIPDDQPLRGSVLGPDGKPVDQLSDPGAALPSGGTGLFDRMGMNLPDLPPEKPYTGKVDEAYGAFQRGFYLTALDKALPRAQLGDAAAQTLIAELLARGLGVRQDVDKAVFWYSKAADGGDPNAMFKYALLLMEGRFVKKDKAKADELMKKAADAGNSLAAFNWAQLLVAEKPGPDGLKNALPYYEMSASKGIADAEYAVSQIYLNLPDIPADKRATAKDWLLRAAKAGYDTAQFDMAVWLIDGIEFKRDIDEGFNWMLRASVAGNVAAQNKLAHLYIQGIGTPQDLIAAAKWYVLSRRAGREDPELEDFYQGLTEQQQKQAIVEANKQQRVSRRNP